jgi:hypothetical protein
MLKSNLVLVSCVAIVTGLLAAPTASGNIPHTNYLTFSAPFALPGVSLPAGTYVFDVVVVAGSHDVVRVTSRDGSRIYLTAFTARVQRPKGLPVTRQIVFNEAAAGTTPPVKAWFPIGQAIGHQFIYDRGGQQLDTLASR